MVIMAKKKTGKAGKTGKRGKDDQKKGSTKTLVLLIALSLFTIIVFKTGFIFFVIGLLPSIVAYYIDITRSRTRFHTVLACNLSGLIPFMTQIWKEDGTHGGYVTSLMSDPMNWLQIYSAAGFGWLLVYTTPLFAQFIISMFNRGQIARFQSMQDRIIKDWGPEVAHMFPTTKNED